VIRANLIGADTDCSLSPTLFKKNLDRVLRNWKRKCQPKGTKIQNTSTYIYIVTKFCIWPGIISTRSWHGKYGKKTKGKI